MRKLVTLAAAAAVLLAGPAALAQDDPGRAPVTTRSADGRTVTGAGRSLSASQVDGLDPAGQTVTVSGNGYDADKGIYVTFCVIPPPDHQPTPCGGGQDRSGSSGSSGWVSSTPPDYAAGLTTPYAPGGSFTVELVVQPAISDTIDCRSVRCAIVTRNDHTRSSDRSQDLLLPVTFRSPDEPAPATTLPPVSTTTTVAAVAPVAVAPPGTVAADGASVSDGTRTLGASAIAGLGPGEVVTVSGAGFDAAQGIYVALCRVPDPGRVPQPCATGDGAAWVSSNPPDYGRELARPFGEGGGFEVALTLDPRIDETTDCSAVPCAIATRSDDTAAGDRRNDLLLPVTFQVAGASASTNTATDLAAVTSGGGGGSALPLAAGAGAGAVVLGAGAALVVRSRRRGPAVAP